MVAGLTPIGDRVSEVHLRRPSALVFAALAVGCGPVLATSVVDDAEVALARAHAAEGEKYALYETTLADLYLIKAKEEQGHARYSEARDLAADALQHAEAATRQAAEHRTSADAPPVPTANVQHPEVAPPSVTPPAPSATPSAPPERKPKSPIDPGKLP